MFLALECERAKLVELLIERGVPLNQRDNDPIAAVAYAFERNSIPMTRLLLEAGANVNQAQEDGATPLYASATDGHEGVVRALLEAKAEVNQGCEAGTALDAAKHFEHTEVQALLRKHGAE